jgi:hypothetical protein
VGIVALEEERVLSLRRNFINLAVISGGDIKIARLIENQVPDVLRSGREIFGGTPRPI